jgi:hypothetical protein
MEGYVVMGCSMEMRGVLEVRRRVCFVYFGYMVASDGHDDISTLHRTLIHRAVIAQLLFIIPLS